jgi:hypothetical protein
MKNSSAYKAIDDKPKLLLIICGYIVLKAIAKTATSIWFLLGNKATSDGFDVITQGGAGLQLFIIAISAVAIVAAYHLYNFNRKGLLLYIGVIVISFIAPLFFGVDSYRPTMTEFTLSAVPVVLLFRYWDRMAPDAVAGDNYFSNTIDKSEDWFWDWVDYNQKVPGKLVSWFNVATSDELIIFYRKYKEIADRLIPNTEPIYVKSQQGTITEEAMAALNNWIIVQGKPLWATAANVAAADVNGYVKNTLNDDKWEVLLKIQLMCAAKAKENTTQPNTSWQGTAWQTRFGYFPATEAKAIFDERFGGPIEDFLSD